VGFVSTKDKKLDSEERESDDSVPVTITGTESVSSSQACKDVRDGKHAEKTAGYKKRPSLYWIAVLLAMWCLAVLKGISIVTNHGSNEMKKAWTRKLEQGQASDLLRARKREEELGELKGRIANKIPQESRANDLLRARKQ
jgi:hypothetical protein